MHEDDDWKWTRALRQPQVAELLRRWAVGDCVLRRRRRQRRDLLERNRLVIHQATPNMQRDDIPNLRYHRHVTTLARSDRPHDTLEQLRARVGELETILAERTTDAIRVRSELDAFRIRYRQQVGRLHEELDRLELELAEAELGILKERLGDSHDPVPPPGERIDVAPRFTTDAVRKLFRDVAKAIHPDLAQDEAARDRRHALMVEANRAYELGDEEQLRAILQAWERAPEAVPGSDAESARLRLERRIAQVEDQIRNLDAALVELRETSLWKLKTMVDEEAAKGHDLIKDMIRRLNRDILVAANRLDALRPPTAT